MRDRFEIQSNEQLVDRENAFARLVENFDEETAYDVRSLILSGF
jgi:hypothetical protein